MNKQKKEEEKNLLVVNVENNLDKPKNDMLFAQKAAQFLVEAVYQAGWVKRIGTKDHLLFEAWQTVGKFYGYTVKTDNEVKPIEIGGVAGFEATAQVIDNRTGFVVGGAKALCMRDEMNWKGKPTFQLASMAQTRAGSKALRQILSFVVALAGYNPTPAEEMEEKPEAHVETRTANHKYTPKQWETINNLLKKNNKTQDDLVTFTKHAFGMDDPTQMNIAQASAVIQKLFSIGEENNGVSKQ